MIYQYKNTAYPNAQAVLAAADLGAGDELPSDASILVEIRPLHDPDWQYLVFEGGTHDSINRTFTLGVKNVRLYAKVAQDSVVELLSRTPADGWIPVPFELNRHIRAAFTIDPVSRQPTPSGHAAWRYDDDTETFRPHSTIALQAELNQATIDFARDVRQSLSGAVDHTEVGGWLMNAVGVSLKQAGLPTPSYDQALLTESELTGETVEELHALHVKMSAEFHSLFALTQGMRRSTQKLLTEDIDTASLLQRADVARQKAQETLTALGGKHE